MKYAINDGIRAACERAQRVGHEINVYISDQDVIIVSSVKPDSSSVKDAKWVGQAAATGEFTWKTKQENFS